MKSKKPVLIGCVVFPLVLVLAFIIGFSLGISKLGSGKKVPSNAWLLLDSSGVIADYKEVQSSNLFGSSSASMAEILHRIRSAAGDSRIQGIVIKPGLSGLSYVNLHELELALKSFKASGKPVIAYGDMIDQTDYLVCALADSIWMNPSAAGGIILEGVAANVLFYKDALQKLGIRMHVIQSGDYKGAGEPYINRELSPGTKENLMRVLKARYDNMIKDVAAWRHTDSTRVLEIFEKRDDMFISAKAAKKYGLIDHIATWEDLKNQYGISKKNTISIDDYSVSSPESKDRQVALVYLSGEISSGSGYASESGISASKVRKIIEEIKKNKSVKAVVLRINSPGGSALESELIHQELSQLGKELPIVVSMGGVAASGGYYISCAGQYIFADPYTITGSIGVISAIPETKELGNKLGLNSQTLRYGKFAAPIVLFETYNPAVVEAFHQSSREVYQEFQQRVMDARKISPSQIKDVAEGRVWSAKDALNLKLTDATGSLQDAITKAAALAKLDDYSVTSYPSQISIYQAIRESGFFKSIATKLQLSQPDPAELLKAKLYEEFPPYEWQYRMPWKLD